MWTNNALIDVINILFARGIDFEVILVERDFVTMPTKTLYCKGVAKVLYGTLQVLIGLNVITLSRIITFKPRKLGGQKMLKNIELHQP